MESFFIIIQVGYEGIDGLLFPTTNPNEARDKIKQLRQEIVDALKHRDAVLAEFGSEEDEDFHDAWERMYIDEKITYQEYHNSKYVKPDQYCIQKWDGENFTCCCKELGCEPTETWIY